jgi:hypothetical protein
MDAAALPEIVATAAKARVRLVCAKDLLAENLLGKLQAPVCLAFRGETMPLVGGQPSGSKTRKLAMRLAFPQASEERRDNSRWCVKGEKQQGSCTVNR